MKNYYLILLIIFLNGCRMSQEDTHQANSNAKIPIREYSIQSVLWQQLSAEYKALCHQAFNLAKFQLDKILLEKNKEGKPLAIITDIDETVLDNSPFNAKMIETDEEYSKEN